MNTRVVIYMHTQFLLTSVVMVLCSYGYSCEYINASSVSARQCGDGYIKHLYAHMDTRVDKCMLARSFC
jgi:hypothetical protein